MAEEEVQFKIPAEKIRLIREADSDYKLLPAKDITIIALNHFLYGLKQKKKA